MSGFLKSYTSALKKYPKTTNALMTGSLFGLGDAIAQVAFPDQQRKSEGYDIKRTLRSVAYGSLFFSFVGDKWYKFLNNKIRLPHRPINHWSNTVCRVGVDQLGFSPIGVPLYFGIMTILEGRNIDEARTRISDNWWPTLVTNWAVWPAFQLVNFSLVPLSHRLLAVNLVSIFWNTFLSYKNSRATREGDKVLVNYPPAPE